MKDVWGDGGTQYIARWNDVEIANSVVTGKVDTVEIGKCSTEEESLVFSRNDDTSSAISWIRVGKYFEFQLKIQPFSGRKRREPATPINTNFWD